MDELVKTRGVLKASLTRFMNYLDTPGMISDIPTLKVRLEKFEPIYEKFCETQDEVESLTANNDNNEIQLHERTSFENSYFKYLGKAKDAIRRSEPSDRESTSVSRAYSRNSTDNIAHCHDSHLPKVNIPKFDGAYNKWVKFRDSFTSLIHNNPSLNNIQKFHHLDSALEGKASQVIASLGISESNYNAAWAKLQARYEDDTEIIQHHVSDMFNIQKIKRNSSDELRTLIDTFDNNLVALKSLKEPTDSWDTLVMYLLTTKLNNEIKCAWENKRTQLSKRPSLKDMLEFLESHCKYLNNTSEHATVIKSVMNNERKGLARLNNGKFKSYAITGNNKCCVLCKENHALFSCNQFKQMPANLRLQKVRELKLCFNCLASGHSNRECQLGPCRKCGRKHNSLLHLENGPLPQKQPVQNPTDSSTQTRMGENSSSTFDSISPKNKTYSLQTLNTSSIYSVLATATVYTYDINGKQHEARVYLDSCSQAHLITKEFCERLGLEKSGLCILSGIEHNEKPVQRVSVKIKSRINTFTKTITCLVWNQIDTEAPSANVDLTSLKIPTGIQLADPKFHRARPIDMLIGVGLFYELLCVGRIQLERNQPTIQKTLLGWIIAGDVLLPQPAVPKLKCRFIKNDELNKNLQKFWEIEHTFLLDPSTTRGKRSYAEEHFVKTTDRDVSGRFIVSIPLKESCISRLGSSRETAQKRLFSMEKKLANNPKLQKQYIEFMDEYEALGHMSQIPINECNDMKYHFYLPHHAVIKESSTTTKVRVVFDGSAKSSSGVSLNDIQDIGESVQDDLFSIIVRFRQHNVVLSADIAKMYRQILIKPEERAMQRILWRSNSNEPIKVYELNTVTYGTASAPFLATRCLKALGESCNKGNAQASNVILHDFYVDDLLSGADSPEAAIKLKNSLNAIFSEAGMQLRKWQSNNPQVSDCSSDNLQVAVSLNGDRSPKTLGLLWDPQSDTLKYEISHNKLIKVTKRNILSVIAQIFDPLGLVGPAIIPAKIIMRMLWDADLNWDESLPQNIHSLWLKIYHDIQDLNKLTINRLIMLPNYKKVNYHGFCDASEAAYGACIYVSCININGERTSNLLCAKSRIAPKNATSIPRLELQGALLLAQLSHKVSKACNISKEKWYFWTDSKVTLDWIKAPSSKWKTFVANRTAEIQELTNDCWNHVISSQNPADLISRGVTTAELIESTLWWHGPSWLCQEEHDWPMQRYVNEVGALEQRQSVYVVKEKLNEKYETIDKVPSNPLFSRFSSLLRLYRVIGYIYRFLNKCNVHRFNRKRGMGREKDKIKLRYYFDIAPLSANELEYVKFRIIKLAQNEMFFSEISILKKGELNSNSNLKQLRPFIDNKGLLRVGGRLENSELSYDKKHPIILASKHKFTLLLIKYEHERLLHAGCQAVISSLRNRFWPLACKNTVKGVLRNCIVCFKIKPNGSSHIMGNLPSSRITPVRPFHNCGVDYTGYFLVKEKGRFRTSTKVYVCIFVCFVTKAVHIELANDLSSEAFINCFKRFISRRGLCRNIYSDNGTNFVGAEKDLKIMLNDKNFQNEVTNYLSTQEIKWHFNPPSAPHFGGLWESAVKSAKFHLKRIVGETRLTFEELYTILTQIEACLNSRPLSPLSTDPNDLTPLTPGHFLIGDSLTALPQEDLRTTQSNRLTRYKLQQQIVQHFWQRWSREYLPQLQNRTKWHTTKMQNVKPGAMVLIKEDNAPPLQWPLGRITEVHPGKDNIVRVVTIRVARGTIQRPVAKICVLPINEETSDPNEA